MLMNFLLKNKYKIPHTITATSINNKGNNPVKNILNIATEGVKAVISASLMIQSNDKNASEDAPIRSTGYIKSVSAFGNFKLKDNAAVSN